jgi:hypothetical protein
MSKNDPREPNQVPDSIKENIGEVPADFLEDGEESDDEMIEDDDGELDDED